MRILKQTRRPHPLVIQPRTILVPLLILLLILILLIVLSSAVGGVLEPHSI
jgi:hypothetical protein